MSDYDWISADKQTSALILLLLWDSAGTLRIQEIMSLCTSRWGAFCRLSSSARTLPVGLGASPGPETAEQTLTVLSMCVLVIIQLL